MQPIGIIANPNSGKDIRRLVSAASVFNDLEKANIIKRLLITLESLGAEEIMLMPDPAGMNTGVLHEIGSRLNGLKAHTVQLPLVEGNERDSIRAAAAMADAACACLITLGGDGTNRVVAKTCGEVPLIPISTGTNNVYPRMMEATIAAMAAAAMASGAVTPRQACTRTPLLELHHHGGLVDIALIDMVVIDEWKTGARAVWSAQMIRELFLTRARPTDIGLSSIGGCLRPMPLGSGKALHILTGKAGQRISAPIAPGSIQSLTISRHRAFGPDETIRIESAHGVIALDGEREMEIKEGDSFEVKLNPGGPWTVDMDRCLTQAVSSGFFQLPDDLPEA